MNPLLKYKYEIEGLCKSHAVTSLYVFGSTASGRENEQSDIDLLVRFGNIDLKDYFSNFMDFKSGLESIFHKKVDLVEEQAVKNPVFRNSIDRTKKLIYG